MKRLSLNYAEYYGVALDPVSQTVPDQSLSVEDILRRFTAGTITEDEVRRDGIYSEDIGEDMENPLPEYDSNYDLVDAFEASSRVEELRQELASVQKETERRKRLRRTTKEDDDRSDASLFDDKARGEVTDDRSEPRRERSEPTQD